MCVHTCVSPYFWRLGASSRHSQNQGQRPLPGGQKQAVFQLHRDQWNRAQCASTFILIKRHCITELGVPLKVI